MPGAVLDLHDPRRVEPPLFDQAAGLGTAVTRGTGADGSERPGFHHLPRVLEGPHVGHGRRGEGREPRGHGPTPLVEGVRPPGVDVQCRKHSLLADRKRYGQRAESTALRSLLYVIPPAGFGLRVGDLCELSAAGRVHTGAVAAPVLALIAVDRQLVGVDDGRR